MRNIIIGLILAAPAQAQTYPIRDYLLSGGSLTTLVEVHQDIIKTYPDFDQWLLSQRRPELRTRQLEQLQNAPRGILLTVSRVLDQELPGQPWRPGLIRSQHPQLIPKIAAAIDKQHGPQIRQFLQTYQPPAEFHTQMYERYPDLPHILKKHGIEALQFPTQMSRAALLTVPRRRMETQGNFAVLQTSSGDPTSSGPAITDGLPSAAAISTRPTVEK